MLPVLLPDLEPAARAAAAQLPGVVAGGGLFYGAVAAAQFGIGRGLGVRLPPHCHCVP